MYVARGSPYTRRLCKSMAVPTKLVSSLAGKSPELLSHDFTMVTYYEHVHYVTKWHIRHTQSLNTLTEPTIM